VNKFEINKSKCAGCGACLRACPHGAIKIGEDEKAFIDQNKCKKCGTCQKICPFDAIEKILEELDEKNVKQPKASSSSALAPILYGPPVARRRELGTGRGFGRDIGRGLGRGPRDGRGGGRGGGGRGR